MTNDETLHKLIAEIDAAPAGDEPRSNITTGKPEGYIFITANRSGLISLARSFLLAALSPIHPENSPRGTQVDESHLQVIGESGDLVIGWIQQEETVAISKEAIAERRKQAMRDGRFFGLCFWTIGIGGIFLLISGFVFWIGLLFGPVK